MDWMKFSNFEELIAALAPGFIILYVRHRFNVVAPRSMQENVIAYAAISALYYSVVNPLFDISSLKASIHPEVREFVIYFFLPGVVGIVGELPLVKRFFNWGCAIIGLRPLHPTPNAWDYSFSTVEVDTFLVVTLNDGQQIAGKYGEGSFSSSDTLERDIFIAEVWDLDGADWQEPSAPKKVLLSGRDIQSVEFFKKQEKEEPDE